jgi:predicted PurR-regulated permease PerM
MKEKSMPFLVKLVLVLLSIFGLGYLAKLGQSILAPLLFAFLLAILFLPFANFLERKLKFNRTFSTITSVLVMILVLIGISTFFVDQLSSFSNDWPSLEKQFQKTFDELQAWVYNTFNVKPSKQIKYINEGTGKVLSSSAAVIGGALLFFTSGLGFLFFSILFFFFILSYRRLLYNFIIEVFHDDHFEQLTEIISEIQNIIKQYITGLFFQIILVSFITSIALSIMGVKYAILIGVLAGILNVIPYLGIFSATIIACLISFATGGATQSLYVLIAFVAIHAIDGNIILPLVVGSKVKINALFSFLAILIGERLWGISGMFLSIPFLAIVKIIFDKIKTLQPWGKLIGEEEKENNDRNVENIKKNIFKIRLQKFRK